MMGKLGNDKLEFKVWEERLENAFEQTRPGVKKLLQELGRRILKDGIPVHSG